MSTLRKRSIVKTPSKVFKHCPQCDSPNLIKFDGEVICHYCDWTSIEVHADAKFFERMMAMEIRDDFTVIENVVAVPYEKITSKVA